MLGWKAHKHYYETDELPNPRPTQPNKIRLKVAFGPLFPTAYIFWWVWIDFIWETDYKKVNPTKFCGNSTLYILYSMYILYILYILYIRLSQIYHTNLPAGIRVVLAVPGTPSTRI